MSQQATVESPPTIDPGPPDQSGSYPIVEPNAQPETPQNGHYPEHVPQFSVAHELPVQPTGGKRTFNSETARLAGLRSAEARRERQRQLTAAPKPPLPVDPRLELVKEQITRTRASLNDDNEGYCEHCQRSGMPAHHRAQLLRALASLVELERDIEGKPRAGTLKPQSASRRRSSSDLAPEPIPTPQEPTGNGQQ